MYVFLEYHNTFFKPVEKTIMVSKETICKFRIRELAICFFVILVALCVVENNGACEK